MPLVSTSLNPLHINKVLAQGDAVHSLLVNPVPVGRGQVNIDNDIRDLSAALNVETRPHAAPVLSRPANWQALQMDVGGSLGATGAMDLCLFYLGTHGRQLP